MQPVRSGVQTYIALEALDHALNIRVVPTLNIYRVLKLR
jgi:hypothetical protein